MMEGNLSSTFVRLRNIKIGSDNLQSSSLLIYQPISFLSLSLAYDTIDNISIRCRIAEVSIIVSVFEQRRFKENSTNLLSIRKENDRSSRIIRVSRCERDNEDFIRSTHSHTANKFTFFY